MTRFQGRGAPALHQVDGRGGKEGDQRHDVGEERQGLGGGEGPPWDPVGPGGDPMGLQQWLRMVRNGRYW